MVRSTLAAMCALALLACAATEPEAGRSRLRGGTPSELPTPVALMAIRELPVEGGAPLRVVRATGTGVLLCPNVVLTVQHVADFGPFTVTSRQQAFSHRSVVGTDLTTGERRTVTVGIPTAEDARQVGEPVRRTLLIANDSRFGEVRDGLALLQVDPPFPADLPYPALSTVTDWSAGEQGRVHGFGASLDDGSDDGLRRHADLPFLQAIVRSPQVQTRLLAFAGDGSLEGDSGGPIFGPLGRDRDDAVAGLDIGTLPGQPVVLSFDLAANADWIVPERDRLCAQSAADSSAAFDAGDRQNADEDLAALDDGWPTDVALTGGPTEAAGLADGVCLPELGDCGL